MMKINDYGSRKKSTLGDSDCRKEDNRITPTLLVTGSRFQHLISESGKRRTPRANFRNHPALVYAFESAHCVGIETWSGK